MGCGNSINVKDPEAINYYLDKNIVSLQNSPEKIKKKTLITYNTKNLRFLYAKKLPKGLLNNGNTCYLNSPFQALINCRYFIETLLKEDTIKYEKGSLIQEFVIFLENYCKETPPMLKGKKKNYIDPDKLVQAICAKSKLFTIDKQEDTHELLIYLIDTFQEETKTSIESSNLTTKASETSVPIDIDKDIEIREEEYWTNFLSKNNSFINDFCFGLMRTTLVCHKCDFIGGVFEPFSILSLNMAIDEDNTCNLEDCFQSFFEVEEMKGENKWECDKCKEKRRATRSLYISK